MTETTQTKTYVWGHALHCVCGWISLRKHPGVPAKCEACEKPANTEGSHSFTIDGRGVAGMICTVVDIREKRLWEIAKGHGLLVFQNSPKRWSVFKVEGGTTVTFKDGEVRTARTLKLLFGPESWQKAMKYIRDNTPAVPDYLKK